MNPDVEVDAMDLGIPSVIHVVAPKMPDVKLVHNLPESINVRLEVPVIPDIRILPPANFPTEISMLNTVPETIRVDATGLPSVISLDASGVPSVIRLEVPSNFPSTIKLDTSGLTDIQVKGVPDTIVLKHDLPKEIIVKPAENLEIPLVYRGGPIPIQMDMKNLTGENGEDLPCFAIVPCKK
jgi:hypothetical protein